MDYKIGDVVEYAHGLWVDLYRDEQGNPGQARVDRERTDNLIAAVMITGAKTGTRVLFTPSEVQKVLPKPVAITSKKDLKIGSRVLVTREHNFIWMGEAEVVDLYPDLGWDDVKLLMKTGRYAGSTGAFEASKLLLLDPVAPVAPTEKAAKTEMKILHVKRNTNKESTLKVYGKVLGESGKVYGFAYFRGVRREWTCTCENFGLNKKAKGQNCKHLQFVRTQLGRYAATVAPTKKNVNPDAKTARYGFTNR